MTEAADPILGVYQKLARAVEAMEAVAKTKTADTGKYQYTYASLGDVLATAKEALATQSLVLLQPIAHADNAFTVNTTIIDKDTGMSVNFPGPPFQMKGDPQAIGSAITYGRRYALTSLLGLNVEDDDGAMAHRAATRPGERTEAEKQIRALVGRLPDAMAKEDFQSDFRDTFGSSLTNLPENRHGDALTWAKEWESEKTVGRESEIDESGAR